MPENMPVPVTQDRVAELMPSIAMANGLMWHVLDVSTEGGKSALFNIRAGWDKTTTECYDKIIDVQHVVFWRGDEVDEETGEVRMVSTVVLVDPSGFRLRCHSPGIISAAMGMVAVWGKPPWSPPKRVRIVPHVAGAKRASLEIQP